MSALSRLFVIMYFSMMKMRSFISDIQFNTRSPFPSKIQISIELSLSYNLNSCHLNRRFVWGNFVKNKKKLKSFPKCKINKDYII